MKNLNKAIKGLIFGITLMSAYTFIEADNHAPIIQPGAPGFPSKILNELEATNIANTSYIKADVDFLQGMIIHHMQAILMSEMADNSVQLTDYNLM